MACNEDLAELAFGIITGFAGGLPKVEEIMAYFQPLTPKSLIETGGCSSQTSRYTPKALRIVGFDIK
jgi:hypothetical protein